MKKPKVIVVKSFEEFMNIVMGVEAQRAEERKILEVEDVFEMIEDVEHPVSDVVIDEY